MSEEQLEYSAKLLADNISLEKRNKEIYEGFMVTTQELCEVTKEIERLNNIIKDIKSQLDYLETYSSKEDVFEDMKRRLDRIESIIGSDK